MATKTRVQPLGPSIDILWAAREKKRAMEADLKVVEDEIKKMEEDLLVRFDKEGITSGKGVNASVSITSTVTAQVEDWDAFAAFVIKTKAMHLVQRRVSDPAARELFETKGQVPGLVPFTKRRINIRTVS